MSTIRKNSGYDSDPYKSNEVSTMSQGKLIVMLYDGAIRFLKIARENMTPKKYEIVNNNIIKAEDIITELISSLNFEAGGEIAQNLLSIYIYIKNRLLEANTQKDPSIIDEVIQMLGTLKEAWEDVAKRESTLNKPAPSTDPSSRISIQG